MADYNPNDLINKDPKEISDDEKQFLSSMKDRLDDDVIEKFALDESGGEGGSETEDETEKEGPVNPDDFEVETVEESGEPGAPEDVDEEDAKTINKVVDSRVQPIKSELEKTKTETQVANFLVDNPEFKKYKEVIKKYKTTPNSVYSNVPIPKVAKMIAYEDAQKIGAKKERDTQEKVKKSKGGGSSTRENQNGEIDWMNLSKEEYQKKKAEVLRRSS